MFNHHFAGVAQLVERPICNRTVVGSIPATSNHPRGCRIAAIATDCKSVDFGLRWFESSRPQTLLIKHLHSKTLFAFTFHISPWSTDGPLKNNL